MPCGPINTVEQAFADKQVQHRGMRVEMDHPVAGTVALAASPMRLSASPVSYRRPPPGLGEHTQDVLGDLLGLDAEALARLKAGKVI